jgi:hypothetical protein
VTWRHVSKSSCGDLEQWVPPAIREGLKAARKVLSDFDLARVLEGMEQILRNGD